MNLYRIKLSTKSPRYTLKTFQLTADNLDEAINKAFNLSNDFKKVESVDVYLERGKAWLTKLS